MKLSRNSILLLIGLAAASVIISSALFVEVSCTTKTVEVFEERQLELSYGKFIEIKICTTGWDELITIFEK